MEISRGGGPQGGPLNPLQPYSGPQYPRPRPASTAPPVPSSDPTGILNEILAALRDIHNLIGRAQQQGFVMQITLVIAAAGGTEHVLFRDTPIYGLVLTNDGPSSVDYQIPYGSGEWQTINPNEVLPLNYIFPVKTSLGFRNTAALAASLRISATL